MLEEIISELAHLADLETYACRVWRYQAAHSEMLIRFHKEQEFDENSFFLLFSRVAYFEGPMVWKGAAFSIGAFEECKQTLTRLRIWKETWSDEIMKDVYRLYKLELDATQVRIIASPMVDVGNWFDLPFTVQQSF